MRSKLNFFYFIKIYFISFKLFCKEYIVECIIRKGWIVDKTIFKKRLLVLGHEFFKTSVSVIGFQRKIFVSKILDKKIILTIFVRFLLQSIVRNHSKWTLAKRCRVLIFLSLYSFPNFVCSSWLHYSVFIHSYVWLAFSAPLPSNIHPIQLPCSHKLRKLCSKQTILKYKI